MSTAHNPIKLFETVVDECPYLDGQQSASILVDPEHKVDENLFALLSRSGFRRSGEMLYSPKCPSCTACISVRVPTADFKVSRNQKRVWHRNMDLTVQIEGVEFKEEQFQLYLRYQQARHPESSMCDEDPKKYVSFINSQFSKSRFLCFYLNKKLIGVSVMDQFEGGLSAVYTFFDPQQSNRSIGTYAILYLIKLARLRSIPHVYLGYWIEQASKMSYKQNFRPLEGYIDRQWVKLEV
jgi:arginine-tRNA-protein transferase